VTSPWRGINSSNWQGKERDILVGGNRPLSGAMRDCNWRRVSESSVLTEILTRGCVYLQYCYCTAAWLLLLLLTCLLLLLLLLALWRRQCRRRGGLGRQNANGIYSRLSDRFACKWLFAPREIFAPPENSFPNDEWKIWFNRFSLEFSASKIENCISPFSFLLSSL